MRRAMPIALGAILVGFGLTAGPAMAAPAEWKPAPPLPPDRGVVGCPGLTFSVFDIQDDEVYREYTTRTGTKVTEYKGALVFKIVNDQTGRVIIVDASGPQQNYAFKNGWSRFNLQGNSLIYPGSKQGAQKIEMQGLPYLYQARGAFSITVGPKGYVTQVQRPAAYTDLCKQLAVPVQGDAQADT